MPIKHIVMFGLQEGTTDDDIKAIQAGLLSLPISCPEIQSYELGLDLLLESGQKHPAGPNRRISWSATFASIEDYQSYNESAAHKSFLSDILLPKLAKGTRAAIQYEIP